MVDFGALLQNVAVFLAGIGSAGSLLIVYQVRAQAKEAARERLRESVLTKEFLACLDDLVTLTDLARCWLNVREHKQGTTTISIEGRLVTPTSESIKEELGNGFTKAMNSNEKAVRSGCFFLMPKHIRKAFEKLYSETQSTVNRINRDVNDIDDATIQRLELAYTDLEITVRDTLGLSILDC